MGWGPLVPLTVDVLVTLHERRGQRSQGLPLRIDDGFSVSDVSGNVKITAYYRGERLVMDVFSDEYLEAETI
jgi:hypothetical protein